jgi:hypothetical protein
MEVYEHYRPVVRRLFVFTVRVVYNIIQQGVVANEFILIRPPEGGYVIPDCLRRVSRDHFAQFALDGLAAAPTAIVFTARENIDLIGCFHYYNPFSSSGRKASIFCSTCLRIILLIPFFEPSCVEHATNIHGGFDYIIQRLRIDTDYIAPNCIVF